MLEMRMITILGPTASGKTPLAAALAQRIGGEIISADSRQVYRRMDIGTGKDLCDYAPVVDGTPVNIPYHLIDICEPGTKYNLFQYQQDFFDAYNDIVGRGKAPILCGGTGLYIEAVLKGYKLSPVPQNQELRDSLEGKTLEELTAILAELKQRSGSVMHNKTDVDSCQRAIRAIEIETYNIEHPMPLRELPPIDSLIVGVNIDRDLRRESEAEADALIEEARNNSIYNLTKSSITHKEVKQKGEVVDEYFLVALTKFIQEHKNPTTSINLTYDVEF